MAVNLRGVVATLQMMRPDVSLPAKHVYCVSEAARRFCRRTWLAKETISTAQVLAGSLSVTVTPTLGALVGVDKVWMAQLPSSVLTSLPAYLGTYHGGTGAVTPINGAYVIENNSASHFQTNGFYICATAGSITPDDNEWPSHVGDIMYSDGNNWQHIRKEEFTELSIESKTTLAQYGLSQNSFGVPTCVTIDDGIISLYPPAKYDTAILIECAYSPTGEVLDSFNIPANAEDCILDGALAIAYSLPGVGQDKKLAYEHDRRFRTGMDDLAIQSRLGQQGMPFLVVDNFLGRD